MSEIEKSPASYKQPVNQCLACRQGRMHSHQWAEKVAPVTGAPAKR